MDWGGFLKHTGIVIAAVLAALAAVLAWIERLLKVRELQRRLEQLEHERKQRISRIHLPSDAEVRKYGGFLHDHFTGSMHIDFPIEELAHDLCAYTILPLKHAADMIDAPKIGTLPVEMVRSEFAAMFTALKHLEVIAQTGLASDDQFHKIVAHTAKFLREIGQDGVAMLDIAVGIPVASRFLGDAESVESSADLRD